MKKITRLISSIFLLFFLFIFNSVYAQLPFSDDFESGNLDKWVITGSSAVSTDTPVQGIYSLKGTNEYSIQKDFASLNDEEFVVDYKMRAAQSNKRSNNFIVYDNSVSLVLGEVYFNNTGSIVAYNGPDVSVLQSYDNDIWYDVKVVFHQFEKTYDIYINNNLVGNGFAYKDNSAGDAFHFYWGSGETTGSIGYVDVIDIHSEGIIAFYPFNGNAFDETGNGNDGTVNNAVLIADRDGNANKAYYFNGDNAFINVLTKDILKKVTTRPHTFSVWITLESSVLTTKYVIDAYSEGANGDPRGLRFESSNNPTFKWRTDAANYLATSSQAILSDTTWHQIVGVFQGTVGKIFVDGQAKGTTASSGTGSAVEFFKFGVLSAGGSDGFYHGSMDEIKIFDRALSDSEVAQMYNEDNELANEKAALMALYNTTTGTGWNDNTNWGTDQPLGTWYGVTTSGEGHVTRLELQDNNLVGTLPTEIGNLPYLEVLNLRLNTISNSIPVEIGNLTSLTTIDMAYNQFSGNMPSTFGNLSHLTSLSIYNNQLSGNIPATLGSLSMLEDLHLNENQFSGNIPTELQSLSALRVLSLGYNQLSGNIPSELGNLTTLTTLWLSHNNLNGLIPSSLGNLINVTNLHMDNNKFSGELPASLASLTSLDVFWIDHNGFDVFPSDLNVLPVSEMKAVNNSFTFEDLENLPNVATYNPQDTISVYDTTYITAGVQDTLRLKFDSLVNNSTYKWFRNGNLAATTSGNSVLITESDAGTVYFSLEITNTSFSGFTLLIDSLIVITESSSNYSTNFDEYNVGDYLAEVDAGWDTWDNAPGTSTDALISSEQAQSTPNSVKVQGSTDVVYRTGNHTSGRYELTLDTYIPTDFVGYFNVEHTDTPGEEFAMDCFFNASGNGQLKAGATTYAFTYNMDAWNMISLIVDLDNDWAKFKINGTEINQWHWSEMTDGNIGLVQLGILDFFANTTNGTPLLYFDNVVLEQLSSVNCSNIGITGTFNNWGSDSPDESMTQDSNEPYKWTDNFTLSASSELKFRQNEEWTVNWGDDSFPIGTGVQDGSNIPATAATYFVHFNCESGDYNFESTSERDALMVLYDSTDGTNWTNNANWGSNEPISSWHGVYTNEEGYVDTLYIGNNNLNGFIPSTIGDLTHLKALALSGNTLSGSIPSTIGNLSQLTRLSISQCQLSGSIPSSIGNLSNLTWVALWQNNLSGVIPASFWNLTSLEYIWLGGNADIVGSFPAAVGNLSSLKTLWIDGTKMSGSLPSEIGQLTLLEQLKVHNNKLSGEIPTGFSGLTNLQEFYLYGNNFKGELPGSMASLSNLNKVLLSDNEFDILPSQWSSVSMDTLNVQNNLFSFEDLENLPTFGVYNPQDTLSVYDTTQLKAGVEGLIQLDFDGNVSGSSYKWYRDGIFVSTTSGNSIIATESNVGTQYFSLEITNTAFGGFVLHVDSVVVITTECTVSQTNTSTDISCFGGSDGSITITASGGQSPYSYSINGGVEYSSSEYFPGLLAGDYNLRVKDNEGCESDIVDLALNEPDSISIMAELTSVTCYGASDGSISLTVSGGTPAYTYNWTGPSGYTATTKDIVGLSGGEYNVSVTDDQGCTKDAGPYVISEPNSLVLNLDSKNNVSCSGANDGSIFISVTGGSPTYSYSWVGPAGYTSTAEDIENLAGGDYTVTVSDANGCQIVSEPYAIEEPDPLIINLDEILNLNCFESADGAISVSVLGGLPPYTYSWSGPNEYNSNEEDIVDLEAGEYSLMVEDINYCFVSENYTINEPPELYFTENISNVACYGESTGSVVFSSFGGTSPYEYSIDNGVTYQTSNSFTGLAAGTYDAIVRDDHNCLSSHTITIEQPETPLTFTETVTDVLCTGDASGGINISATGGTPTYEYSIDDGVTYQSSNVFTGLTAGEYSVMTRDANACISNHMVTVNEPTTGLSFTETVTDVLCTGDASGSIDITATGGTPAYEYSIDNGVTYQAGNVFTGLIANDYTTIVLDANGCTTSHIITVNEPGSSVGYTTNITNVTCFGGNDGEIEVLGTGGISPYEYSKDGGVNWQTANVFTDLIANTYDVYIRDVNGCEFNSMQTVSEPGSLPTVSFSGLDAEYCENSIAVTLTGNQAPDGSFTGPGITDNGDGTASFDPAGAGVGGPYDVTYSYSDINGCSNFETQQTNVNLVASISFTGLNVDYCIDNGSVTLTGSEAPNGSFSGPGITDNGNGTASFNPASAGAGGPYDILYEFTDINSCVAQTTNQTTVNDLPDVSFSGLDISYCSGDAAVIITGNQAPNGSFTGTGITDNGDGTATFDPVIAGIGGPYNITYSYTASSGCTNSETQQTSVYDIPTVSFTGLDANYCAGDPSIIITGSEAPNGSFSGPGVFDQGNGTALFYPVVAGIGVHEIVYSYENVNGCIGTDLQSTAVNELPVATFTGLDAAYCQNAAAVTLTGNYAPNGIFTGAGIIDNGDGTATFDPVLAGSGGPFSIVYSYTSPEGCSDNDTQEVEVFAVDDLNFTTMETSYCSGVDPIELLGNIAPDGSFSGDGITDNGDGTATFDPAVAGVGGPYSILYFFTNTNGCYSEFEQQTEIIETPDIVFTGLNAAYCISNEAITLTGNEPLGSFSGEGITDNGDGTASFDPALAGAGGPYLITYIYTNPQGCTGEYRQEVQVYDYVNISITGLNSDYCQFDESVVITGSEAPNGTFSGPGIIDNGDGTAIFDPIIAGVGGPYSISYVFVNGGVCTNSTEQNVMVNAATPVTFTGLPESSCNENYNYLLTGSQAPNGYFLGQGLLNIGDGMANFNPSLLGVGGPYTVTYYYENEQGCTSSSAMETMVIEGPVADFSYDLGGCFDNAVFMDQSSSPNGNITSWSWNFDDPDSELNNTSTEQNPLHAFVSNQSAFHIEMAVMDEFGCTDTTTKLIEPFSTSTITGNVISSEGQVITDGYVLAFLLSDGVISTKIDSVQIQDDGTYTFENMASCVDYIFHGYSNVDVYPNIIPRWHVDAFYWFDAEPINVAWEDELVEGVEIDLYEIVPPTPGTSELGGGVYYGGSKGEPVNNIDVVLEFDDPAEKGKGDEVIGYKPTDAQGQWAFDKLPEGIFKVKIDIPGLTMDSVYTINITQPYTVINNLNYYIDTLSGIFTDFTGLSEFDILPFGTLSVFPNPNNGHFYLEVQKSENISYLDIQSVELWDMEGRLVKDLHLTYKGERLITSFDLDDVQPGMYFIKVKNNDAFGVKKFVIQR